jgi:hypothetical protein
VCGRSSTTCSTCRNFRRSVALGVGYCGLDARRVPLSGDEIRPCWEPITVAATSALGDATPLPEVIAPDALARPEADGLGGISQARR